MAFATCAKLGQDLVKWLNSATQAEKDVLCEAWPCKAPGLLQMTTDATLIEEAHGKLWVGTGGVILAPKALPIGFSMDIKGAATVSSDGVILSDGNKASIPANGHATLTKISASTFWLYGDLT